MTDTTIIERLSDEIASSGQSDRAATLPSIIPPQQTIPSIVNSVQAIKAILDTREAFNSATNSANSPRKRATNVAPAIARIT